MPGVRVIPSSAAANVPDTQMGKIQQRVGELFGQAKEETEEKVPAATQNIRDQVQNRFAELSNKGRDVVEQRGVGDTFEVFGVDGEALDCK